MKALSKRFLVPVLAQILCLGLGLEARADSIKIGTLAGNTSAVIMPNGTLWAWGQNVKPDGSNFTSIPVQIGSDTNWLDVDGGWISTKTDGTMWAGGYSASQIQTFQSSWAKISKGSDHYIAVKSDGTLWSWGTNTYGQLGLGNTTTITSAAKVGTATNWVAALAANQFSLAIKSDGTLWSWGLNDTGQLGIGNTTNKLAPVQVGTATDWVKLSAGASSSYAIKTDGTLWAWGYNSYGQLGIGNTVNQSSPVQVGTDTDWVEVARVGYGAISVKTNGTRWGWGRNLNGVFGSSVVAVDATSNVPVQLDSETNWIAVRGGGTSGYYLKSDETLWAAGYNNYGQLGNGTTTSSSILVQVLLPGQFDGTINLTCPTGIFAGDTQSCTAEVPDQGSPVTVTWSFTDSAGNPVTGDTITDQGNVGLTYTSQVHPGSTLGERKVRVQACIAAYPGYPGSCGESETTMQITRGTITIGDLIGPSQLEWTEHATVEVPSVTTSFGTYTETWTIVGAGGQKQTVTPTGTNVTAVEVWSTDSAGGTMTVRYKATSNEDPQLTASKLLSITAQPGSIQIGDLTGPTELAWNTHGTVEVPSVSVSYGGYTEEWTKTGPGVQSQQVSPTGTNIAALDVWTENYEGGTITVTYTARSTISPSVSASKQWAITAQQTQFEVGELVCTESVHQQEDASCVVPVTTPSGVPARYNFNVGDGTIRSQEGNLLTVRWSSAGTKTVTVTAFILGTTIQQIRSDTVEVIPSDMSVTLSCPAEGYTDEVLNCTTTVNAPEGFNVVYSWSYEGGGGSVRPNTLGDASTATFFTPGTKTVLVTAGLQGTSITATGTAVVDIVMRPNLTLTVDGELSVPLEDYGVSVTKTYTANMGCPTGHTCEVNWVAGADTGTGTTFNKTFTGPGKYNIRATARVTDAPEGMTIEKSVAMDVSAYIIANPTLTVRGIPSMVRVGTPVVGEAYSTGKLTPVITWTVGGASFGTGETLNWTPAEAGNVTVVCKTSYQDYPNKYTEKAITVTVVQSDDILSLSVIGKPTKEVKAPAAITLRPQFSLKEGVPLSWATVLMQGATFSWTLNGEAYLDANVRFGNTFSVPGTYTIGVQATLSDGRTLTASETVEMGEPYPPALVVKGIPTLMRAGAAINGEATVSGKLSGAEIAISWTYPGGTVTGANLNWTPTEGGEYQVVCRASYVDYPNQATEKVINMTVVQSSDIMELQMIVRPEAELHVPVFLLMEPVIAIYQDVPYIWRTQLMRTTVFTWKINGVDEGTGARLKKSIEQPGEYTVELKADLSDGRSLTVSRTLTILPALPLNAVIRESVRRSTCLEEPRSYMFGGITTGGAARSRINLSKWFIDDVEVGSGTRLNWSFSGPGTHSVRWEVENTYGQAGQATTVVEVTEETTPTINFRVSKSNQWDRAPLTATILAMLQWGCNNKEPLATYTWKLDGQQVMGRGLSLIAELEAGDHTVEFSAITKAGRVISGNTTLSVHENLPPVCEPIQVVDDAYRKTTRLDVMCQDPDGKTLSYGWMVNNVKAGLSAPYVSVRTAEAQHMDIAVTVKDLYGGETVMETAVDIVR